MLKTNYMRTSALVVAALAGVTACGGGGGGADVDPGTSEILVCDLPLIPNEAGTMCVEQPPIECDAPLVPNEDNDQCVIGADPTLPVPTVFPGDNQAVLYYNRAAAGATNNQGDPSYEGWRLHTWNNDACNAYADPDTDWANGRVATGIDPNYGAYWVLDLIEGHSDCHNFIVHIGTDDAGKDLGGLDQRGSLVQDDATYTRVNFTLTGESVIFEFPILSLGPQPVKIEGESAHWLDPQTILWDAPDGVVDVRLHYSADADIEASLETGLNGTMAQLDETVLTDEQIAIAPHLGSMPAFAGTWSDDDAKTVLKTQAIVGGYDSEGTLLAATGVQIPNVLDQLYTLAENDADEAQYGPIYSDGGIAVNLWAPTAQNVRLLTFNENKTDLAAYAMTFDDASGIWYYSGDASLDRVLYRYEVTVYHPETGAVEVLETTDPYSVAVSTNGRFSRFVNMLDEDLKPDGWDSHEIPTIVNPEDAVIYEGHIRNFSALDQSTSEANRGKYLAFTESDSAPVMHLESLVEAGLTHFHMLPANDIATIEEDETQTVDLYSTVGDLCRLNSDADVCSVESADARLIDVFESYDPLSEAGAAQTLAQSMRGVDRYNWGYDPHHFNTPEGSYASSAEGVERIVEMRAMIQALHEMGLRVVLDVVFNHTNASGVNTKSVLDKVVPGYYHRYEVDSGDIVRETCCDDTEPRNVMMEKLMLDSLVLWTEHYKFDSFRFDIMSQATKATMVRLRDAIQAIDTDNYFYGEGWNRIDRGYEQANQLNMAGTEIGTFNDRIRESIRQGHIFNPSSDQGLSDQDRLKIGLAGTLTDYLLETSSGNASSGASLGGYGSDPADIINYVSKHDNETLWDQFNYTLPSDITLEQRVRAQNVGISLPLVSQGIPFLQMGGDMLRSKSMDRNTYDAGDWFNYVDFTKQTNNWNVGLPLAEDNQGRWAEMGTFIGSPDRAATPVDIEFAGEVFKEFLQIRTSSPLFRLTTMEDVINRIGFHNIGTGQQQGLIAMSLDDGITPDAEYTLSDIDPMNDAIMVVINTGYSDKSITVNTATGFQLHSVQMASVDGYVQSASFTEGDDGNGTFTVPGMTIAVFVKPQMGGQGYGLAAFATAGAPDVAPYDPTSVYLRGSMNEWSTNDEIMYQGDGIYQVSVQLTANTEYQFKIASEDWATVNFGAADGDDVNVMENEGKTLATSNNNLVFTPSIDATYVFTLDANVADAPVLTIANEEPFVGTPVFLRGAFNGWGTDNEFAYEGSRVYATAIALDAGSYEFKVASEDWSTVNLGAVSGSEDDRRVTLGQETMLAATNDNLFIEITDATTYVFVFDASDLSAPKLSVFKQAFFEETLVYLRGGMNGWGTSDQFEYQNDGTYSLTIDLPAGGVEFKVASEDWATVNLGNPDGSPSNIVQTGVSKVLGASNNNLMIDVEAGTYRFTVSGPNGNSPTLTVTQE